jgi:putative membrane protein
MRARRDLAALTLLLGAVLLWSGRDPTDRPTWWLEVAPVLLALPNQWATHHRFPLTRLLYVLIGVHGAILCYGGAYTYAETPLGYWMQDTFGFVRNHYDRIGHLAQGFIPAILVRELLLRQSPLRRGGWLTFLVPCVCLAFSACYEFLEWWTALVSEAGAEAFLGTQGDPWDTQWDMFLALIGAIVAPLILGRLHDRQLAPLMTAPSAGAAAAAPDESA